MPPKPSSKPTYDAPIGPVNFSDLPPPPAVEDTNPDAPDHEEDVPMDQESALSSLPSDDEGSDYVASDGSAAGGDEEVSKAGKRKAVDQSDRHEVQPAEVVPDSFPLLPHGDPSYGNSADTQDNSTSSVHPPQVNTGSPVSDDEISVTDAGYLTTHHRVWPLQGPIRVPFAELPDPTSERATVPPATIRWRFNGAYNSRTEQHSAWASFLKQLYRQLGGWHADQAPQLSFPQPRGQHHTVDVTFPHRPHFERGKAGELRLKFNGKDLVHLFTGPLMPPNGICILVKHLPSSLSPLPVVHQVSSVLATFGQTVEAWGTFNTLGLPGCDEQFAGVLHFLFLLGSGVDASSLPGWALVSGNSYELRYKGRLAHCSRCRGTATVFHTIDYCDKKKCYECQELGHFASECPRKQAAPDADMGTGGEVTTGDSYNPARPAQAEAATSHQ